MYSDVMEFYGLSRELSNAGYFETNHYERTFKDIQLAIKQGGIIILTGLIGMGKTVTLRRIQQALNTEKDILVCKSLSLDKARVNINTLISALFYDLATDKNVKAPSQPERRERMLQELLQKRRKPIALFIDEAHDLHPKTLISLKRLLEVVQDAGGTLAIVLVGHPKLRNDLRRATMEEVGSRAKLFTLNGIQGQEKDYLRWMLEQCSKPKVKPEDILTPEAIQLLAERLVTPLQMASYTWQALEAGFGIGEKPVGESLVKDTLAFDLNELEAKLTRHGYSLKVLCETLNARPQEVRAFLQGSLSSNRVQEFQEEIQKLGIL